MIKLFIVNFGCFVSFSTMLSMRKKTKKNARKSFIGKLWISGNCSSAIIIPKPLAEIYHMTEACHVSFAPSEDGIIMRKIVQT
jgi:hypothetical protein